MILELAQVGTFSTRAAFSTDKLFAVWLSRVAFLPPVEFLFSGFLLPAVRELNVLPQGFPSLEVMIANAQQGQADVFPTLQPSCLGSPAWTLEKRNAVLTNHHKRPLWQIGGWKDLSKIKQLHKLEYTLTVKYCADGERRRKCTNAWICSDYRKLLSAKSEEWERSHSMLFFLLKKGE